MEKQITLLREYKRCPVCSRVTNGIEDFRSLVNGSTAIKTSCKKCRISTYNSYKKHNQDKYKNIKELKKNIDYESEYKEYKRCPKCNRETNGINDFKHLKNDTIVKTCITCREEVKRSRNKRK